MSFAGGATTLPVMHTNTFLSTAVLVRRWLILLLMLFLVLFLGACSAGVGTDTARSAATPNARVMTVYRSPDCSCCHLWADLARDAGWTVATVDVIDMASFKADHGIPADAASCHTAVVGEYVVEGHVPMAALDRLLAEGPDIDGIGLPGMPAGSPGMSGVQQGPFEVLALQDGAVSPFGSY